jgi:UDP-glucuronate decarboxylase
LPSDDPKQRCPDITLARNMFDFNPTTDIITGIENTIRYFEPLLKSAKNDS